MRWRHFLLIPPSSHWQTNARRWALGQIELAVNTAIRDDGPDGSNVRTDEYGGSIENRARFLLEVIEAVVSVWRGNRVGVRIAPSGTYGSMQDSDPEMTFGYVAEQINRFGLAYLHIIEPRIKGIELIRAGQEPIAAQHLRPKFTGTIIAAGGFAKHSAEAILKAGHADLVAFG
jgi:N-ethylmaleimide reductase